MRAVDKNCAAKNCAQFVVRRRPTSWFWPSPIWSRPTGRLCARGIDLRASESRRLTPPPPRARRSGGGGDAESDDECDGEGDGSSRSTSKRTKARTPGSAARMSARWATTTPLTERIRSPSRSEPCCCVEKGDDGDAARGGAASSCVTVPSSVRSKPTRSPAARTNQVASAERGPTERARFSCDSCLLKMEGAIRHGGTIASSESARSFHETLRLARRIGMSPELVLPGEPWSSKSLKVSGGLAMACCLPGPRPCTPEIPLDQLLRLRPVEPYMYSILRSSRRKNSLRGALAPPPPPSS